MVWTRWSDELASNILLADLVGFIPEGWCERCSLCPSSAASTSRMKETYQGCCWSSDAWHLRQSDERTLFPPWYLLCDRWLLYWNTLAWCKLEVCLLHLYSISLLYHLQYLCIKFTKWWRTFSIALYFNFYLEQTECPAMSNVRVRRENSTVLFNKLASHLYLYWVLNIFWKSK